MLPPPRRQFTREGLVGRKHRLCFRQTWVHLAATTFRLCERQQGLGPLWACSPIRDMEINMQVLTRAEMKLMSVRVRSSEMLGSLNSLQDLCFEGVDDNIYCTGNNGAAFHVSSRMLAWSKRKWLLGLVVWDLPRHRSLLLWASGIPEASGF